MIRLLLLLVVVFDISFLGAMLYFKHMDHRARVFRADRWYAYWMAESATWDWDSLVDNPPFEDGKIATDIFVIGEIQRWEVVDGEIVLTPRSTTPTAPTAP